MYLVTTLHKSRAKIHSNPDYIHFNAIRMSANFNKLKSVLSSFDVTFDVIAVSETWLNNDDLDYFHMDDYDDTYLQT